MDFEQLAGEYSNMIHSIIHSLRIYKDQDEFYQVGLIALWDASKNFDRKKGSFSTYAYGVIRGRLLNALHKEKKSEDRCFHYRDEDWIHLSYDTNVFEQDILVSYFHRLSDKEKTWVILRFYYGLSNKEMAEKLNVKVTTIRSYERRAMKKFKQNEVLS